MATKLARAAAMAADTVEDSVAACSNAGEYCDFTSKNPCCPGLACHRGCWLAATLCPRFQSLGANGS